MSSVPNSGPHKCHRLAEDCLQRAIMASSVELADQWLRIAGSWLAMEKFKRRRSEHAVQVATMSNPGAGKNPLGSPA
jgi:hypothetical protein